MPMEAQSMRQLPAQIHSINNETHLLPPSDLELPRKKEPFIDIDSLK